MWPAMEFGHVYIYISGWFTRDLYRRVYDGVKKFGGQQLFYKVLFASWLYVVWLTFLTSSGWVQELLIKSSLIQIAFWRLKYGHFIGVTIHMRHELVSTGKQELSLQVTAHVWQGEWMHTIAGMSISCILLITVLEKPAPIWLLYSSR